MDTLQRQIEMLRLATEKSEKLSQLKDRGAAKKAKERDVNIEFAEATVATARENAIACLDVWEAERRFLKPHPLLAMAIANDTITEAMMAQLDTLDTNVVLAGAVVAHRLANPKSRGKRLWIFRAQTPESQVGSVVCRFCEVMLEAVTVIGIDWTDNPEVKLHTVTCALRYLIGMPLVGQPSQDKSEV